MEEWDWRDDLREMNKSWTKHFNQQLRGLETWKRRNIEALAEKKKLEADPVYGCCWEVLNIDEPQTVEDIEAEVEKRRKRIWSEVASTNEELEEYRKLQKRLEKEQTA